MEEPALALDLGQTGARIRLVHGRAETPELTLGGVRYGEDVLAAIERSVLIAAQSFGLERVAAVSAGATGFYGVAPDVRELTGHLSNQLGVRRVVVADDAVTSHLGAFCGLDGVLVAAGTGLVGLGIGPTGVTRVDGAGFMAGDEGSGWWIGRQGVIAALSALDGRSGGSPELLTRLERKYGPAGDFSSRVSSSAAPVEMVASFARAVADAARLGDVVAIRIWRRAATFIANAVIAAAWGAGFRPGRSMVWSIAGRLTGAADLIDPSLERLINAEFPAESRVAAQGSSLDGAVSLLRSDNILQFAHLVSASNCEIGH